MIHDPRLHYRAQLRRYRAEQFVQGISYALGAVMVVGLTSIVAHVLGWAAS